MSCEGELPENMREKIENLFAEIKENAILINKINFIQIKNYFVLKVLLIKGENNFISVHCKLSINSVRVYL